MRNLIWAVAVFTFGSLLVVMAVFEWGGMDRGEIARGGAFVLLIAFALVALALRRFVRASFDEQGRWRGSLWCRSKRVDRQR